MKIYTPVKGATGTWCSVRFTNGVGETNDPHLINWFLNHGYRVEDSEDVNPVDVVESVKTPVEPIDTKNIPDLESMTPIQIREWAKTNGFGAQIKNIRNKDKLVEIIRG